MRGIEKGENKVDEEKEVEVEEEGGMRGLRVAWRKKQERKKQRRKKRKDGEKQESEEEEER